MAMELLAFLNASYMAVEVFAFTDCFFVLSVKKYRQEHKLMNTGLKTNSNGPNTN